MLTIVRPAPLIDLADMLGREDIPLGARKLGVEPVRLAQLQRQIGRSWGHVIGGRTLSCCGLIGLPDGRLEAWFACLPAAGRYMLPIARALQLTLSAAADDAVVVARVAVGWLPGERLARAAGFRRGPVAGGETEWLYHRD